MRKSFLALLLIYAALSCWIIARAPFDSFPDESDHYHYIEYVQHHWRLPPITTRREEMYTPEIFQPPLYYVTAAPLFPSIYLLRAYSALLGAMSLFVLYRAAAKWIAEESTQILAVALAALNPQFVFTHCGISNTSMTTFTCSIAFYWILLLLEDERNRALVIAGLSTGLALISRSTAMFLFVPAIGVFAVRRSPLRKIALFLLPLLFAGGWWYIRNKIFYGDWLLWNVHAASGAPFLRREPLTLFYVLKNSAFLFASFWAYFGRNEFHANGIEYVIYLVICIVALLGLLKAKKHVTIWLMLAAVIAALGEILWFQFTFDLPQGRYFYMAIVPLAILMAYGIASAVQKSAIVKGLVVFLGIFEIYLLVRFWPQ